MAQSGAWLTPKEVGKAMDDKKVQEILNDLIYEKRPRRELLDDVIAISKCNEYSAEEFLRDLVKTPQK